MLKSQQFPENCTLCAHPCDVNQTLSSFLLQQLWQFISPQQNGQSTAGTLSLCPPCGGLLQQFINLKTELDRVEKQLELCGGTIRLKIGNNPQNQDFFGFRKKLLSYLESSCYSQNQPTILSKAREATAALQNNYQVQATTTNFSQIFPATQYWPNQLNFSSSGLSTPYQQLVYSCPLQQEASYSNYLQDSSDSFEFGADLVPAAPPAKAKSARTPKIKAAEAGGATPKKPKAPPTDTFSPIVKTADNRLFFENYEILATPSGFHKCKTCGWRERCNGPNWMKMRTMKIHIAGVHIGKYKCPTCSKTFKSIAILKTHEKTAHISPEAVAQELRKTCEVCGKSVRFLKTHMFIHKTKEEKDALIAEGKAPPAYLKTRPVCHFCGKLFNFASNFSKHLPICKKGSADQGEMQVVTGQKECEICGRPVSEGGYPAHVWTHKNEQEKEECRSRSEVPATIRKKERQKKDAKCVVCGFVTWATYLNDHMNTHRDPSEKKMYKCDFPSCQKEFTSRPSVRTHLVAAHNLDKNPKWFRCTEPGCTVKYLRKLHLQKHQARKHKKRSEYEFQCDICNAKLACKSDLQVHRRQNHVKFGAEMYKFQCPEEHCLIKFINPALLSAHLQRWHKETQEDEEEDVTEESEGEGKEEEVVSDRRKSLKKGNKDQVNAANLCEVVLSPDNVGIFIKTEEIEK